MILIRLNQSCKQLILAVLLLALGATRPFAQRTTPAYEHIPSSETPNVASLGSQASQTAERGDTVSPAGPHGQICFATAAMGDWALRGTLPSMDSESPEHPMTLNMYHANQSSRNPALAWLGLAPRVEFSCGKSFLVIDDSTGATLTFDTFGNYRFLDCRKPNNPMIVGVGTVTTYFCKTTLLDGVGKHAVNSVNVVVNTCTEVATGDITFGGVTHNISDANLLNDDPNNNCLSHQVTQTQPGR